MKLHLSILIYFIFIGYSCQQREWDNPFDPDCPKEIFTPSGYKAEQQGNLIKLSWIQTNKNISGFKIERKVGDGSWTQIASEGKNTLTWDDKQPTGGKLHEYRIYAFAGNNLSNQITTQITPLFTATISTNAASNITSSSASTGGNISDDGGATITSRGVCWNTTGNPNTGSNKTSDGTGTGVFASNLTNLSPNTAYYLKAYATNNQGTAYGNEISFTTLANLPSITTAIVSTFTATSAVCGGEITNDGGAQITERGVCWSTTQNPTTAGSKQTIGSGTGVFSSTITGLTANTTYYVRAYAINSQGTAYGLQISFITLEGLTETFTDSRDNHLYKWVRLGSQIWMAENLAWLPAVIQSNIGSNDEKCYYVYGYEGTDVIEAKFTTNFTTYGVLYNWAAAMQGEISSSSSPSGVQGVCPQGWHLPSKAEWDILINYLSNNGFGYLGSSDDIAKSLAATNNWRSCSMVGTPGNDPISNNTSFFSGLPGGARWGNGFSGINLAGYWQSSTSNQTIYSWLTMLSYDNSKLRVEINGISVGKSVRCVKD